MSVLRALGAAEPPAELRLASGGTAVLEEVLQHAFWAVTARYRGPRGPLLVKLGRRASLWGLPLAWAGRFLARRELAMYARCRGVAGVPQDFEDLGDGAFARTFEPGHVLVRGERVADDFFPRLLALLDELHARRIAFVDLQKCENVLVDERGRPGLFDFQTAFHWPERAGRRGLQRLVPQRAGEHLLARLQRADRFHALKHWRRCRPDTIPPEALASTSRPDRLIRLHRTFQNRWRALRRRLGLSGRSERPGP